MSLVFEASDFFFQKEFLSSYIPPHGRGANVLLDNLVGGGTNPDVQVEGEANTANIYMLLMDQMGWLYDSLGCLLYL